MRDVYEIFLRKLQGKRQFERPGLIWKKNIKSDLNVMVVEEWDYIQMAHVKAKCVSFSG
jgi:hypothetical protein